MRIKAGILFGGVFFSCFFADTTLGFTACIKGRDISIVTSSCCDTNCLSSDCLTWECLYCTDETSTRECDESCDLNNECGTWQKHTDPVVSECDRWVCCSTDPQTTQCKQTCCAVELFTANTDFYCADPDCKKMPQRTVRWR